MERKYPSYLEGDVVLVADSGWGFAEEDIGKYVTIKSYSAEGYCGNGGCKFEEYDTKLESVSRFCGVESFGESPLILFNTNDEHAVDEGHAIVAEGSKQDVDKALGITQEFVNKPKHYELFEDVEAIEVIARSLTKEEFRGYCFGNLLKYRLRCGKKDNVDQELAKADKYKELYEKYKGFCYE